jgi:hypothetical protein
VSLGQGRGASPGAFRWDAPIRPSPLRRLPRKRAVFDNALEYAVERKLLAGNPMTTVRVKNRKTVEEVDRRVVVNVDQAGRLLTAV